MKKWHIRRTTPKKNPRRRAKRTGVRIVYSKLLGGWYIVRGPHQTPLSGRFPSKAAAQAHLLRRNPKRRVRARIDPKQFRVSVSGKKSRYRGPAVHRDVRGRFRLATDPRKVKRSLHRSGIRVNPTAHRRAFIVKVRVGKRGAFNEQARFRSKPAALDYARALARANPSRTVAVYAT